MSWGFSGVLPLILWSTSYPMAVKTPRAVVVPAGVLSPITIWPVSFEMVSPSNFPLLNMASLFETALPVPMFPPGLSLSFK